MRWRPVTRAVMLFLLLVLLHYTVRPLIGTRVSADFLVIAVLVTAVQVRPGAAALIGFVTGVVADSLSPLSFGAGAFAMTVVGFLASWLKAAVFGDNVIVQAIFIAAGKWVHDFLYLLAERRLGIGEFLAQLVLWSPLSAIMTGLTALLVLSVFRPAVEGRR